MLSPRENAFIAYRHQQPEYVPCFFTDIAFGQAAPQLERPFPVADGYDAFGVHWIYEQDLDADIPEPNNYIFEEIDEWETKMKFPDLEAIDWELQAEKDKYGTLMGMPPGVDPVEFRKDKLKMCMCINGMFERMHACMGFENALIALAESPEICYDFFGAVADYKIAFYKKIAKYYDYDALECHDDYGSQDRLFMSPATWRSLIKPHLKRIVDAVHEMGFLYQHHSCGYIEPLVEDFIELGMDAVDTWQASCNPNLPQIKQKYQKQLTFCGGFDNTNVLDNLSATPEEIQAEYRRAIDALAPGGSYVAFPITATFGFVGPFVQEHFRYGMSFYQNHATKNL